MGVYFGIDVGTSGTKTLACRDNGKILATVTVEYPAYQPRPGWSEQDPEDWWNATCKSIRQVMKRAKIKKAEAPLTLTLERGPDILRELGESKGECLLIGFAAETENLLSNAREKLETKNLDFIVANDVARPDRGMESDYNAVTILDRGGKAVEVARALKGEVAERILNRVFGEGAGA